MPKELGIAHQVDASIVTRQQEQDCGSGEHPQEEGSSLGPRGQQGQRGGGEEEPRAEGIRNDSSEEAEGAGGKGVKPDGPVMPRAIGVRFMAGWRSPWDFQALEQRQRGGNCREGGAEKEEPFICG